MFGQCAQLSYIKYKTTYLYVSKQAKRVKSNCRIFANANDNSLKANVSRIFVSIFCLDCMNSNELNDQNNTKMPVSARNPPAKRLGLVQ